MKFYTYKKTIILNNFFNEKLIKKIMMFILDDK
jgi:hypothetical protein